MRALLLLLQASSEPRATQEEVQYLLSTLRSYLGVRLSSADVLSVWSGIRPLPSNPKASAKDTQSIVRDHGAVLTCVAAALGATTSPPACAGNKCTSVCLSAARTW